MATATHIPLRARINIRMIVFVAVMLTLLGFPLYWFINEKVTGGIHQAGDYLEVNLKALGNFPFPQDGTLADVPAKWRALDGKKVLLQGEVYCPNEAGDTMSRFELVYSIQACCFGGPPKVQERVFAQAPKEMRVPNLNYGFAKVYGTLHINAQSDAGAVTSLYTLDVEKVESL